SAFRRGKPLPRLARSARRILRACVDARSAATPAASIRWYFSMRNFFESPFKGITLDRQVTHPNISVGRYSYYSGYYHGHSFDDCARFLLPDADADKLVIGSFCSIGSGAAFIMAGNQGHRNDWISTFPFFWMPEVP